MIIKLIVNAIYVYGTIKKFILLYKIEDPEFKKMLDQKMIFARQKAINEKDPSILSDVINAHLK